MAWPSYTKSFHTKSYPSIDPTQPSLSHKGKTVVITGAGSGIARAIALSYARASASHIVLIGRTSSKLAETASFASALNLPSPTKVSCEALDINSETSVATTLALHAPIDILINSAAYLSSSGPIVSTPVSEFWSAFETNLKAAYILSQHFLRTCRSQDSVIIHINSSLSHLPLSISPHTPPSYPCSKIALAKLVECIALQHPAPSVRAYSLHPGVVKTLMSLQSVSQTEAATGQKLDMKWDDPSLAGDFCVWLTSQNGCGEVVPSGRFVHANWDVDELRERRSELWGSENEERLTIGLDAELMRPEKVL